ncbi:MAG: type II toxin-antitoxin system RelE/ParE family toxin [Candidatus Nealsonbacteria bacterium]|nr:type II toxin-antitoxin system RelE/ParE family toxin [Candidatus Nealsonbacteria bacterium]
MRRFRLTERAKTDVHGIWDYIAVTGGNLPAADRQMVTFYDKFALLASQPLLGQLREDLRPDLRVFSAESYVILYYPTNGGIEVVGVAHGAQDIEAMYRADER